MKDKHLTPLTIVAAAAILGISGYFAVGMWAPPKPVMISVQAEQIDQIYGRSSKALDEAYTQLGQCLAKLPATPTPKATPIPCGSIGYSYPSIICGTATTEVR